MEDKKPQKIPLESTGAKVASASNGIKSPLAQQEEKTLAFWKEHKIFKKTLEKKSPEGNFSFYDGPPFATGLPHYGHFIPSTIKDLIPRYKTMRGYHVRRRWGWDCHGLPIENIVEKEYGLKQKSDIEHFGIERFNEAARSSVFAYDEEWKKTISRLGRFVDMETSYKTMDRGYMESVWWAFKRLHTKGLIYEGYKSMHICPRCETTLAVSEVAGAYKSIVDFSVMVKFELVDEPGTYILAWTTTPWTLPGNVALAIGEGIKYAKVGVTDKETGKTERYILAEDRLLLMTMEHELLDIFLGEELVGKEYKPVFDYYYKSDIEKKENGWKIYPASFVKTDEGTGIVHVAPAFGEDDLAMGRALSLPFIQHVSMDGTFKKEVIDFAGEKVKPRDDHQAADIEIIKYLAHRGLLFRKEKITHSYPHCWRCDTPLLNYATSSWFVNVGSLKKRLIAANRKINWVPDHIGTGRFGRWLEGARDWAVSRSRFWGTPLPIWKCDTCSNIEVLGSIQDLREKGISSNNTYFIMRHGQAESNAKGIMNSINNGKAHLTEIGKEQVRKTAESLKDKGINLIVHSPITRAKETAEIVAGIIGVDENILVEEERFREIAMGELEGKTVEEYHNLFKTPEEKFTKCPPGGECLADVKKRMTEALYSLEKKYIGKTILIVSHDDPLWMLHSGAMGLEMKEIFNLESGMGDYLSTGEAKSFPFVSLPHNASFEVDLHRPYIDNMEILCSCGSTMQRIPEIFDCWFESGSMPYAGIHFPFENKKLFKKNFPADFISESLDQTRGWFYSMLVLSVGLFNEPAYKNVIVSGLVMAEDGQKMSKKLKNYPDTSYVLNTYGADAVRYYMISSPIVHGENLDFSEKGVREVQNKLITRLRNVVSFYELYHDKEQVISSDRKSDHVLDVWIRTRLTEVISKVTEELERYELDKAARPLASFIEDLSVWYLRRSRDRFKGDNEEEKYDALSTTRFVLHEFSKVVAPFMPFVAEEIYQKVKSESDKESVHLEAWPKKVSRIPVWLRGVERIHRIFKTNDEINTLSDMSRVREIVALALEARAASGMKVRQPLALLKVKNKYLTIEKSEELTELIREEINVKKVLFGQKISTEVELDTELTQELREEGYARELMRHIQNLRKVADLDPSDKVMLSVKTDKKGEELFSTFADEIKKTAMLREVVFIQQLEGEEIAIDTLSFVLAIKK